MVNHLGFTNMDDSTESQDSQRKDFAVLLVERHLALMSRTRWALSHFDRVSDQGVALGTWEVGSRCGRDGRVAVLDQDKDRVDQHVGQEDPGEDVAVEED